MRPPGELSLSGWGAPACRPVRSPPPGKGGGAWARSGGSPPGLAAQRAASLLPGSPVARGGAPFPLAGLERGAAAPAGRGASGVWKVRRAGCTMEPHLPPFSPAFQGEGGRSSEVVLALAVGCPHPAGGALSMQPCGGGISLAPARLCSRREESPGLVWSSRCVRDAELVRGLGFWGRGGERRKARPGCSRRRRPTKSL